MQAPAFTPYADGQPPFRIGLRPLDLSRWLSVDDTLKAQLDEKDRLDGLPDAHVWMAEPDTLDAQREALETIVSHLAAHHGATHKVEGNQVTVCGRTIALDGPEPLRTAGLMLQEDLVLMRRNEDGSGWRIAAASLHFPSSWSLAEKFGKALADVHAPVPGFERGTRMATVIDRIFDKLLVEQPVWRTNFSLYDNAQLHHPQSKQGEGAGPKNGYGAAGPDAVLRCEYQTLRKLPRSGDIVFTIRIHVDPLAALAAHPDCADLCKGLIDALLALDKNQMAYKGLDVASRQALVDHLKHLGSAPV